MIDKKVFTAGSSEKLLFKLVICEYTEQTQLDFCTGAIIHFLLHWPTICVICI